MKQIPYFEALQSTSDPGDKNFVTWMSSNLKILKTAPSERLYTEGDVIHDFYFMTKGIAAFIKEKQNNEIFGIVDCQSKLEINVSVNNLKVF